MQILINQKAIEAPGARDAGGDFVGSTSIIQLNEISGEGYSSKNR
jgi:hypothetical protein